MASHKTLVLFLSLLSLSSPSFSLSLRRPFASDDHPLLSFSFTSLSLIDLDRPSPTADVHDLLPLYGLPRGLLPENVKSFTLSSDGTFTVKLQSHCYVRFSEELVSYDEKISGKLSYGSVKSVEGIKAKKALVWVPIKSMESDPSSSTIIFSVGFFSKTLPAKLFEDIPSGGRKSDFEESELVASI